jgi:hypothetical protein
VVGAQMVAASMRAESARSAKFGVIRKLIGNWFTNSGCASMLPNRLTSASSASSAVSAS